MTQPREALRSPTPFDSSGIPASSNPRVAPTPSPRPAQPRAAASIFRTSNFFISMNAAITRSAFF
jgi:hypothetical protein